MAGKPNVCEFEPHEKDLSKVVGEITPADSDASSFSILAHK
ncbi:MAG: hypothetical protein WED07_09760 [Candidatus Freyarchaeum deiterrae]